MAENGRMTSAELTPIPVGKELSNDAAASWLAPGGPADAGLRPVQGYRTLAEQEYFWRIYQEGTGNLAAVPGTSNHGWGTAVDIDASWEQAWIYAHGKPFGWQKTEAFSEAWHFNYVGGFTAPPVIATLKKGDSGKEVRHLTKRLAYIHPSSHKAYLSRWYASYKDPVVAAVKAFQKDQGLTPDGVAGPKTRARIDGVFHRQWKNRHR